MTGLGSSPFMDVPNLRGTSEFPFTLFWREMQSAHVSPSSDDMLEITGSLFIPFLALDITTDSHKNDVRYVK